MDIPYNRNRLISIIYCVWDDLFRIMAGRVTRVLQPVLIGYNTAWSAAGWCPPLTIRWQDNHQIYSPHIITSHVKFLLLLSLYILMNGMMWQILLFWEHKIKYFVHIDCKFIFGLKSNNVFPSQTRGWNNIWTIFDLTIKLKV